MSPHLDRYFARISVLFCFAFLLTSLGYASDLSFSRTDVPTPFLSSLTVADFNHDGKLDIVGCTFDNVAKQYNLNLAFGNGDGTFSSPVKVWNGFCGGTAAVDTNG